MMGRVALRCEPPGPRPAQEPQHRLGAGKGQEDQPPHPQHEVDAAPGLLHLPENHGQEEEDHGSRRDPDRAAAHRRLLLLAQDGPGLHRPQLPERKEGEEGHGQKAEHEPLCHGRGRDAELHRGRQQPPEQLRQDPLEEEARPDPQRRPHDSQHRGHGHVVDHQKAARGPQGLHHGDGWPLLGQVGGQGALDADAGQEQGEDADQVQEEEEVVEEALYPRLGGAVGVDPLPVAQGRGPQLSGDPVGLPGVRHLQEDGVAHPAPLAHQPQGGEIGGGHEEAGPQGKDVHGPIRLLGDHVGNGQGGVPQPEPVSHPEAEPVQQGLLGNGPARRQHLPEGAARGQIHGAVEGVARLHRLDVGQEGFLPPCRADDGVELVDAGALGPARRDDPVHRRREPRRQGRAGLHDHVSPVECPGVPQHGAVDAAAEAGQGDQGNDGKGHAEDEDGRLAARGGELAAEEAAVEGHGA